MIPYLNSRVPDSALDHLKLVLDSGYLAAGETVKQFEREFAEFIGAPPELCVSTNSGTAALFLTLKAMDLPEGAGVLTTPMTFLATTTTIFQAGHFPWWVDVEAGTCQMDAKDAGNEAEDASALVAVAWAGSTPDLWKLGKLAKAQDIPFLLDAAQAMGAYFNGRPIHEYADYTMYSFAPTKHLTTGDGGMLVCPGKEVADRVRRLAWFGFRRDLRPGERIASDQDVPEWGYKLHMNNLAAALGLAGLPGLPAYLDQARSNAAVYLERFAAAGVAHEAIDPSETAPYTFTIFVDDPVIFEGYMHEAGVAVGQPHRRNDANSFVGAFPQDLPNTEFAQAHYVSLPVGGWVTSEQIEYIARLVIESGMARSSRWQSFLQ